jgi:hypothetical protein
MSLEERSNGNPYVTHAKGDMPFVKQRVLRILPSNGYDCWRA